MRSAFVILHDAGQTLVRRASTVRLYLLIVQSWVWRRGCASRPTALGQQESAESVAASSAAVHEADDGAPGSPRATPPWSATRGEQSGGARPRRTASTQPIWQGPQPQSCQRVRTFQ